MSPSRNPNQPVVVGVDESEQSRIALRWAAHYATRHRVPLHIVYAIDVPVDFGPGVTAPIYDAERLRSHGESVVGSAAAQAAELTDVAISTAAVEGTPVAVLRHRSKSALLLVVGSRGLGALRRTLLGSVSTSLARHAECPVAVIPETELSSRNAVVVGVDGSLCSSHAIAIAFDEAARRGARLTAVHVWSEFFRYEARATMQTEAEAVLAESLAGYAEKYPEVAVDRVVVQDRPAAALLAVAEGAQLIVVGSHGRGGFAGMTLGSVAQAVLHGAECPLIIARPEPTT
ncbi:universal stress protein [Nocardia rhizosphaerihabitans]|uniref:universal stress protein n=1 Tax=Nocardia rhizosphaerihabitans TaxID=1691570 RepID=UPI0016632E4C|nr:universal stress protein [Nocardia rhizosphaerihabitans]